MKTLAAVLTELRKPLVIFELEIPALKAGQVLVQMAYSGLCHAQLNEWKGTKGADPFLPHTLGHEGSGVVLEIGPQVSKVKPGDRVVLSWIKGQGMDVPSTTYRSGNQIINSGAISTFLEKAVVSENRIIPIASDVPLKEAALLGCAIPTGAGVVMNDMQIKEGQSLVVFGVGGIGSSAIIAARYLKANPIVAIDIYADKLAKAKELGATHCLHAREVDPASALKEIFQGKGADFAFESAGNQSAMQCAFDAVKAPGGLCVLAGNLPKGERIQLDPFDLIRGKKIIGTWGGSSRIDSDIPLFINAFLTKGNLLKPLISCESRLEGINELMESLNQGRLTRGLITFYE